MLACATGQHIKKAVLFVRKQGGDQQEYYTVTHGRPARLVVPVRRHQAATPFRPTRSSLNFAKIKFEYKPQKPDGSLDSAVKRGYDLKANKKAVISESVSEPGSASVRYTGSARRSAFSGAAMTAERTVPERPAPRGDRRPDAKVKSAPTDRPARFFLFELFLFSGDLDRARKQLDVLRYDDPRHSAAVEQYRSGPRCRDPPPRRLRRDRAAEGPGRRARSRATATGSAPVSGPRRARRGAQAPR